MDPTMKVPYDPTIIKVYGIYVITDFSGHVSNQ